MRIAIVENNQLLLETLKILLTGEPDIELIGAYSSADEMLESLDISKVEIILVDMELPGTSGVELIEKLKAKRSELEIMAYAVSEDRENVFAALKSGASAYVLKGSRPTELMDSFRKLYEGGAPMSLKIARMVIQELQDNGTDKQYLLSQREKEVIKKIAQRMTYKEIASKLEISPKTIHSHIKKIYGKLRAQNRQDALLKARRNGIL
jgi:two-component system NarL family response regulator